MLDDQQPQDDLSGRGMPAVHQRQPRAAGQVGAHLPVELVVVQQVVELDEHRVGLRGQFGHAGEHIFGVVAVDEHTDTSVESAVGPSFDHLSHAPIRMNPAFAAPKLHR